MAVVRKSSFADRKSPRVGGRNIIEKPTLVLLVVETNLLGQLIQVLLVAHLLLFWEVANSQIGR